MDLGAGVTSPNSKEVTKRAKKLLLSLESESNQLKNQKFDELGFNNQNDIFFEEFDKVNVDNISPRESLEIFYKLKSLRQINE